MPPSRRLSRPFVGHPSPTNGALYSPYAQSGREWKRWMSLVVRAPESSAALTAAVKTSVWKIDPQLLLTKVLTMTSVMAASFAERRFNYE